MTIPRSDKQDTSESNKESNEDETVNDDDNEVDLDIRDSTKENNLPSPSNSPQPTHSTVTTHEASAPVEYTLLGGGNQFSKKLKSEKTKRSSSKKGPGGKVGKVDAEMEKLIRLPHGKGLMN